MPPPHVLMKYRVDVIDVNTYRRSRRKKKISTHTIFIYFLTSLDIEPVYVCVSVGTIFKYINTPYVCEHSQWLISSIVYIKCILIIIVLSYPRGFKRVHYIYVYTHDHHHYCLSHTRAYMYIISLAQEKQTQNRPTYIFQYNYMLTKIIAPFLTAELLDSFNGTRQRKTLGRRSLFPIFYKFAAGSRNN